MDQEQRRFELAETPFFIVGNPRSGTTLLRFILSSHSRIYIPEETGFLPHLQQYVGQTLTKAQVARLVTLIGQLNAEWLNLVDDFATFYAQLPAPTLTHVLDQLYRIKLAPHQASRWGDKGPSYVRVLPVIERIFPSAQYIHVIRDGRDCTLSALKKWGSHSWYYDTYYLMKNWQRNIRAGQAAGQRLGSRRYMELRYEELVERPAPVVERICEFLGETFEPQMLDHTALARQLVAPTGHFEVEQPISRITVGNWRQRMPLFDQKVAVHVGGRLLAELGYEVPSLPPLSGREWIYYAALASRCLMADSARSLLYRVGWLKMSRAKRAGRPVPAVMS